MKKTGEQIFKIKLENVVFSQKGIKPAFLRNKPFKGSLPYLDINSLETGEFNEFTYKELGNVCSESDVLVVWDGSRCGLTLYGRTGIIGSTLVSLTPIELDSDYLYFYLKSKFDYLNENSTGSNIPHISPKVFFDLKIPYLRFDKQKEIVNNLKVKLQESIVFLEQQKELINETLQSSNIEFQETKDIGGSIQNFKKAILQSAYNGDLTKEWRERSKENVSEVKGNLVPLNDTRILSVLPDAWSWTSIDNIATCKRGRFSARPRNDPQFYTGEYPFIQISDIPDDGGLILSHKQTLNAEGIKVSKLFKKGTVVIAIVGSTIGNSGILGYDMYFPDSIIGITVNKNILNKYISYYLQKEKEEIRALSYSSGGQPNLKIEFINSYPIPLPSIAEQKEIVKKIEELFILADQINLQYGNALADFKKLENAILEKAFAYDETDFSNDREQIDQLLTNLEIKKEELIMKKQNESKEKTKARARIKSEMLQKKSILEIIKDEPGLTTEDLWRNSKFYENREVESFYEELILLKKDNKITVEFEDDLKVNTKLRVITDAN